MLTSLYSVSHFLQLVNKKTKKSKKKDTKGIDKRKNICYYICILIRYM